MRPARTGLRRSWAAEFSWRRSFRRRRRGALGYGMFRSIGALPLQLLSGRRPVLAPSGTRLLRRFGCFPEWPGRRIDWVFPPCLIPSVTRLPHCRGPFSVFGNLALRWRRPVSGQRFRWTGSTIKNSGERVNGTPLVGHVLGHAKCRVMIDAHTNRPRER